MRPPPLLAAHGDGHGQPRASAVPHGPVLPPDQHRADGLQLRQRVHSQQANQVARGGPVLHRRPRRPLRTGGHQE